jgi:hypothetical protein
LVTGSQVLVLNPGMEICAPVCVATALLCTAQPPAPRSDTSLAPVLALTGVLPVLVLLYAAPVLVLMLARVVLALVLARVVLVLARVMLALASMEGVEAAYSTVAARIAVAPLATDRRMGRLIWQLLSRGTPAANNGCPRDWPLVWILSKRIGCNTSRRGMSRAALGSG